MARLRLDRPEDRQAAVQVPAVDQTLGRLEIDLQEDLSAGLDRLAIARRDHDALDQLARLHPFAAARVDRGDVQDDVQTGGEHLPRLLKNLEPLASVLLVDA